MTEGNSWQAQRSSQIGRGVANEPIARKTAGVAAFRAIGTEVSVLTVDPEAITTAETVSSRDSTKPAADFTLPN